MAGLSPAVASQVERTLRTIFRRCQLCPPGNLTCPQCSDGEICSLVPQTCDNCAYMACIANPSAAPPSSGPNIGAIAGGVVGGIAAVAFAVFLVWFFWIRKKRAQQELADWEDEIAQQKTRRFNPDATSTRTRQSLANSFLSRASNIIQIAYIPGVTNRFGGRHSILDETPVPPIPAAFRDHGGNGSNTPGSPLSHDGDALFFKPGDLRDSTYSATSSFRSTNRDTQYTRQSITPSLARSSMVSEIYRDDATTEPMPATTVMRVLPRMVSVKSSQHSINSEASQSSASTISPAGTPGVQVMIPGQSSAGATSVRGKATQVVVGGRAKERLRSRLGMEETTVEESPTKSASSEDDGEAAVQSTPSAYSNMSSTVSSSNEERARRNNVHKLSAVIEEGVKRASRVPSHDGLGGKRDASPFGDEYASG